jgi:hypothetical protein
VVASIAVSHPATAATGGHLTQLTAAGLVSKLHGMCVATPSGTAFSVRASRPRRTAEATRPQEPVVNIDM